MDKIAAVKYLEDIQKIAYLQIGTNPEEMSTIRREVFFENLKTELKLREKTLSPKELEQFRESRIKYFESTLKLQLLTKYEDPIFHSLIDEYSNSIEEGTKIWSNLPEKLKQLFEEFSSKRSNLILGVLPIGTVNAMSITVPKSDDFVVVFESELFTYCLLMSKIVAMCMSYTGKEDNRRVFNTDEKEIMKKIDSDEQILNRFQELVFAYLIDEMPGRAPRYILDPIYDDVVKNLLNSMEIFILGHEYAHILLDHMGKKIRPMTTLLDNDVKMILYQQQQELEADVIGLFLALGAMKVKGYAFEMGYWGIELFFSFDEIIEKGSCILRTGTDEWYWRGGKKDGPLGTHPPAQQRRETLREVMKSNFGDMPVKLGELVEKIINRLWEKTRPELVQYYKDKS